MDFTSVGIQSRKRGNYPIINIYRMLSSIEGVMDRIKSAPRADYRY
ncbi:MAG: hypothetical protein NZ653_05985 [Anaerolineae bacterium]|nr:hypothetical protein [Anaerolineae bacterium]